MAEKDYYVRGTMALLDAVGASICHTVKCHKKLGKSGKLGIYIYK